MQVPGGGGGGGAGREAGDTRGRHRIQAELKKLEQEARFLKEELQELEKTDIISAALQEFLVTIEGKADPLLPVLRNSFSVTAELPEWLTSLGIGGLKVQKICVDANAGVCDHCQEIQNYTKN
ncbi:guanine nucleotide-binding protein subunit gamma 1 isoform X1 [Brachypodium distachyon]|uniref:guanine nucleotide-binding protein subunit gamma 1 isoform X1 n=1 Tax=Brachypodium distachyon TaxID=15368 RepID=UPI00071C6959|nr:guanine nucleotide-binding protein subunit gamma 1 isoform X1 [Brachypodium distachyon]|eukprot:XP_014752024.1 guanine nucleotide-binding protein subunit gamma 1 isoform X1 [Brachypodium distachyon]